MLKKILKSAVLISRSMASQPTQLLLTVTAGMPRAISACLVSKRTASVVNLTSDLNTGNTNQGRRDIRALANPNDPNAWSNQVSEGGLIAMALGYQKQYYKGPKDGETNEAFETETKE